jgi:hypothetical protein
MTVVPDDKQGLSARERSSARRGCMLACPFCGCVSYEYTHKHGVFSGQHYDKYTNADGHKIRCDGCGVQTCWWHTKEEAINAWNARVESQHQSRLEKTGLDRAEYAMTRANP